MRGRERIKPAFFFVLQTRPVPFVHIQSLEFRTVEDQLHHPLPDVGRSGQLPVGDHAGGFCHPAQIGDPPRGQSVDFVVTLGCVGAVVEPVLILVPDRPRLPDRIHLLPLLQGEKFSVFFPFRGLNFRDLGLH